MVNVIDVKAKLISIPLQRVSVKFGVIVLLDAVVNRGLFAVSEEMLERWIGAIMERGTGQVRLVPAVCLLYTSPSPRDRG